MWNSRKQKAVSRRQKAAATSRRVTAFCLLPFAFCLLLTGCRRDMQDQPRMKPYRANALSNRQQKMVEGTVPRGYLRENREFFTGKKLKAGDLSQEQQYQIASPSSPANAFPDDVETIPMTITKEDMDRGQQRYDIYCSVCHGMTGYGDGIVARRGFNRPSPASYHQDRLRQAPVGHFFDAMTNGWGAMPSLSSQISVEDRWRIAAYVRALQLSQMKQGGSTTSQPSATPSTTESAPHR